MKPEGGERVMESRHVVGMFLGVVVMCGIFFTLGYVMGRTQYDSSVRAAAPPSAGRAAVSAKPAESPAPAPPQLDFMKSNKAATPIGASDSRSNSAKAAEVATPVKPPEKLESKPSAGSNPLVRTTPIPRGSIVLQLAALRSEVDALALTDALQQKNYPAYVLMPATGNLYRVQVGPYSDAKSADAARKSLEREGFKAITKR